MKMLAFPQALLEYNVPLGKCCPKRDQKHLYYKSYQEKALNICGRSRYVTQVSEAVLKHKGTGAA